MRSIILFLMFMFQAVGPVFGQKPIPLKAGILTEQISLPTFEKYGSRLGYGFTLGTNFMYKEKEKSALLQTADFHFIYHKDYGTSMMLSSLFDYSIRPGNFNIDVKLGPGLMLFNHYTPLYTQGDGGYEEASRLQAKFAGIVALSCSYPIGSFRPYLAYSTFVESPFITSYSTLLPHQMLEAGVYVNLDFKKQSNE